MIKFYQAIEDDKLSVKGAITALKNKDTKRVDIHHYDFLKYAYEIGLGKKEIEKMLMEKYGILVITSMEKQTTVLMTI